MNRLLDRLNLRRKLVLLSGTAIAALLAAVLTGILGIDSGVDGVTELGRDRMPSILALQTLARTQIAQKASHYEAALWERDYDAQAIFAKIGAEKRQARQEAEAARKAYAGIAVDSADAAAWARFDAQWRDWARLDDQATGLIEALAGNGDRARQEALFQRYFALGAELQRLDRATAGLLGEVIAHNAVDVEDKTRQAEHATSLSRRLMIAVGLFATVLLLMLAIAITRSILRQMGGDPAEAVRVAHRVASGDLSMPVMVVPGDEGSLLAALAHMQRRLRDLIERLHRTAHYDALTQLPNRVLLADRMSQAMETARRDERLLAVCYIDLDGFKPINDSHGHEAGDRLLVEVARRLKSCLRGADTAARLGGDEFVILLGDLANLTEGEMAIRRLLGLLSAPCRLTGAQSAVTASLGVTFYPIDNSDPDTLLRHADQAMYQAKQEGRNRLCLFDPEHDRQAVAHHVALASLREALRQGQFCLYYQPKVDMRRRKVIGAEALIRWQHPERGLLPPGEFLATVKGSDLEIPLGDWVLAEAARQLMAWRRDGLDLAVSVNVSTRQLEHPDFSRRLEGLLAGLPPGALELEILESAALDDVTLIAASIEHCGALGVTFALDDFGTGYSSLSYLKRVPAQTLKIDQSFVRNMLNDSEDLAIVKGVIGLAHTFRRRVIAEGVETAEHGRKLVEMRCDLAQGYGIARPMPAEDLAAWVDGYENFPLRATA